MKVFNVVNSEGMGGDQETGHRDQSTTETAESSMRVRVPRALGVCSTVALCVVCGAVRGAPLCKAQRAGLWLVTVTQKQHGSSVVSVISLDAG